ncbi:hypothetical protein CWI36_2468p0010 [Hamiltosporidium magnivora]|uniref:Uncharacterized protein n=1 Tax=Hamiltosporidium magnivora TaxID=148818 RepID=A0A4V2JU09_9MICR|nr:hypothetical protein CWI36_2468p0010 [Hamiltosporidium magnivora]
MNSFSIRLGHDTRHNEVVYDQLTPLNDTCSGLKNELRNESNILTSKLYESTKTRENILYIHFGWLKSKKTSKYDQREKILGLVNEFGTMVILYMINWHEVVQNTPEFCRCVEGVITGGVNIWNKYLHINKQAMKKEC